MQNLTVGMPVSLKWFVSGGSSPYIWSAQGLPDGLELHTGNNVTPGIHPFNAELWGVPTQADIYNSTFNVTDSLGSAVSQTYTIRVVALDNDFPPWPGQAGMRGAPFSFYLRALGGTGTGYSWGIATTDQGRLPARLTLNSSTASYPEHRSKTEPLCPDSSSQMGARSSNVMLHL